MDENYDQFERDIFKAVYANAYAIDFMNMHDIAQKDCRSYSELRHPLEIAATAASAETALYAAESAVQAFRKAKKELEDD